MIKHLRKSALLRKRGEELSYVTTDRTFNCIHKQSTVRLRPPNLQRQHKVTPRLYLFSIWCIKPLQTHSPRQNPKQFQHNGAHAQSHHRASIFQEPIVKPIDDAARTWTTLRSQNGKTKPTREALIITPSDVSRRWERRSRPYPGAALQIGHERRTRGGFRPFVRKTGPRSSLGRRHVRARSKGA